MNKLALAMFVLATAATVARADVCVVLDQSRDTLSPDDRKGAEISFAQALAKAGVQVTNTNCTVTYTFYDVKLGDSITVYAQGPTGPRQARASKLDELPLVYEQMAHSMVTGQPMGLEGGSIDRTNATNDQMAPRRVASDNVKIFRLGYGGVTGASTSTGPVFGAGWRFELDQIGIELAGDIITATDNSSRSAGFTGDIRIGVMYYQDPIANSSFYYGGGIGYGASAVGDGNMDFAGAGLEGNVSVGYETLRASTIRLFGELTTTLPFYTASEVDFNGTGSGTRHWLPSMGLSFGIGWGHSNTIAVVQR
jgi:hypothetical protein